MKLWRLTRAPYLALDGSGSAQHGARWTSPGLPVVNFASEASLAILIVLRYYPRDLIGGAQDYLLGWTETNEVVEAIPYEPDPEKKRSAGDDWFHSQRSLFASVPSAVVPEAEIILMNTRHPSAHLVAPLKTRKFSFEQVMRLPPLPETLK